MFKKLGILLIVFGVLVALYLLFAPIAVEALLNPVQRSDTDRPSSAGVALHNQLFIADWHNDALLWRRDLNQRSRRGQVDFPRMQQGNAGLLVFTTVTQVPMGQNYHLNSDEHFDKITPLVISQGWPLATWQSPLQRALYQGQKLDRFIEQADVPVILVTSQQRLQRLLEQRQLVQADQKPLGVMLGIEGGQALEGKLSNIDVLYAAGFRVVGLQHFFDNELGGSLHGASKSGLTPFGRQVVKRLNEKSMIIDVAHSSLAVIEEVLALSKRPVVLSHTGVYSACASERNVPDALLQAIAAKGGIIGIGFWQGAVCDPSPQGIARTIAAAVDLVGIQHVSLGSDFNGSVATTFDVAELALLTSALLDSGLSPDQIRQIMGGNIRRFLGQQLPSVD